MSEHIYPGRKPDDSVQYIAGFNGELIEVTSLSRPDTSWLFVDSRGHEHRWFDGDKPATSYSVMRRYSLPTLVRITDVEGCDDYPGSFHYECAACMAIESETVKP